MATNTYVALNSTTLANNTTNYVEFTAIPQTYTDLVLVTNITSFGGSGDYIYAQWGNGSIDTGSNYSTTILSGNGSSAVSTRFASRTNYNMDYFATPVTTEPSIRRLNIMNYSNTTTYKTILSRADRAGNGTDATVGTWRSTQAINTLRITTNTNFFASGSTFSLYGIAKGVAVATSAKATGGTITYAADGYTYHAFTSSGTFTPSQALTNVDYLVVAGGGGGSRINAGGGAGGLRSTVDVTGGLGTLENKLSLANGTAYTVTIGQGGPGGTGTTTSPGSSGNASSIIGGAVSITSLGGGGGGSYVQSSGSSNGLSGGSGGGAGFNEVSTAGTGGAGTTGQGFAGGDGLAIYTSGGGGGAGGLGVSGRNGAPGGNGGIGVRIPNMATGTSTGVNYYYAGGGGAGDEDYNTNAGTGGLGGGGNGANRTGSSTRVAGSTGTANTGGGGGGGENGGTNGYAGGSGIVIIRYAN
jgi:hypothetical protein